jgi:NAD(P)H-nitrite reductase large subunit
MDKNKVAVIGYGCAAAECIKALRENSYSGEIHVFTDSRWPVYNPMLTTYYIAGKINFNQLFPYGEGEKFCRDYNVSLHPGSPVINLDAEKRIVTNKAGLEYNYRQCLISSGSSPILPPIDGINYDKVYVLRTPDDAARLKQALGKKPEKALVVGASLVGIKIMELLHNAGIEVCLVDSADRIFPSVAHSECSQIITDRLIKSGIIINTGVELTRIEDCPEGIRAYFNNNETRDADLLIICTGVRPNTQFINPEQVEVNQGIPVNEHMMTNIPGLYAAGDVAEGKNLQTQTSQVISLWVNARYQGRTAGSNMAGTTATLPGNIHHNITHFMGMDFISVGDICDYDKMDKLSDGNKYMQLFWKNELLTGANFIDFHSESGIIKNAIIKGLISNRPVSNTALPLAQNLLIKNILLKLERVNNGY